MTKEERDLARKSNVELNNALYRVRRNHPDEWNHPKAEALRAEMRRRSGGAEKK